MVTTRKHKWLGFALAAALLAPAIPAVADTGHPPPSPSPVTPPKGDRPWDPKGNTKRHTYQNGNNSCHVVSSAGYMGATCIKVNGTDGTALSIKELLGGEELPGCWDIPLSDKELNGLGLKNGADYTWYWHKCLYGIDPETFEIHPPVIVRTGLYPIKRYEGPPDYVVVELTPVQTRVVERYTNDDIIPPSVLGISPDAVPLVNQQVSFFDYVDKDKYPVVVDVPEVDLKMRAHIDKMKVLPTGRSGPVVPCDGLGYRAEPGEVEADHPDGCWYAYKQSTLAMEDDAYKAEIHTHWVVEVSIGGGEWQHFNDFWKGSYWMVGVNEVQAVVVP